MPLYPPRSASTPGTQQQFTSTGTRSGTIFTVTAANATVGATYTNNSQTFTVLATISAGTTLFMSGTGAPQTSGTLTKSTGTGDASITFSVAQALATYTTPTNCVELKVSLIAGGGGGGGAATGASSAAAGGGGGGGGGGIIYIPTPATTYFYAVATAGSGGTAGNNAGATGGISWFLSSFSSPPQASGGAGGGGSTTIGTNNIGGTYGLQGVGTNCTINLRGQTGDNGMVWTNTTAASGFGGAGAIFGGNAGSITNATLAGTVGLFPGGGGSGGAQISNGGTRTGGNGSDGYILVEEFY